MLKLMMALATNFLVHYSPGCCATWRIRTSSFDDKEERDVQCQKDGGVSEILDIVARWAVFRGFGGEIRGLYLVSLRPGTRNGDAFWQPDGLTA